MMNYDGDKWWSCMIMMNDDDYEWLWWMMNSYDWWWWCLKVMMVMNGDDNDDHDEWWTGCGQLSNNYDEWLQEMLAHPMDKGQMVIVHKSLLWDMR